MALSQVDRVASVTTPGNDLLLHRMTGSEQLSRLFEYNLELLSENDSVDLKGLLGNPMTVKLNLVEGGERYFNGMVTRISQFGMTGNLYSYRATLRPKPWILTRSSNCRIYQEKTIPQIVKSILGDHGFADIEEHLTATYETREYCVQYRETDFNFISRLMEEEGIYYYFKHADGSHTLALCDGMSAHDNVPGTSSNIMYFPLANYDRRKEEHIYEWSLSQEIQSGKYQLNDFDFEAPNADLKSLSSITEAYSESGKEVYDYPGEYTEASVGTQYVKVRMEELSAQFEQIAARGDVRRLATGAKFTLTDYPRADQNRTYLVLSSNFQIHNNGYASQGVADSNEGFQSSYTVISTASSYRPPRQANIPIVQGVQTAIVVGKSGEEIWTDQYGRIKVQFHWDRVGEKNENSSCWVRVAQVWAGKNWGAMHIPRIGQEVIVDFLEGNPDCPIVTGRVYNADQMPPYTLPDNQTQSGIKSRSSKEGTAENFNEIRFEDKKGEEELYIHAEKNATRIVENNDVQKIGLDKKDAGDQTIEIHNHRTVTLNEGNDTLTIKKGNRTVKVDLGKIEEEAKQSIELKVGQNSIKIDQSGVTIKGLMIKIEGQTTTDVKGMMTTVNGDTMLTLKGAMTMIN